MSERERDDTEIEFDFFDDAPTTEAPPKEVPPPRRRRRMPPGPTGPGGRGIARLVAVIGGAILLAVVLVLWVNSCRESKKESEYRDYMKDVSALATQSAQIGKELNTLITTPGKRLPELQSGVEGLRQQQAQTVASAQKLQPPGTLREQQESLVEALQFRVSGLAGLAEAFGQIEQGADAQAAGEALAGQAERLLASDVVWEDLFLEGAKTVLKQQAITGVDVPDSNFIPAGSTEFVSSKSWTLVVQRLTQSPTTGGLHGNQIIGVQVLPGKQNLSATEENTVTASDRLGFKVLVKNSGDNQETQVKVTMTLQLSPEPIQKEQVIDIINPGDTKAVTFRPIDIAGGFGTLVILKVAVEPVPGEANTSNNTAQYSIIFTLG